MLALIEATVRTNAYRPAAGGGHRPGISYKFDTSKVPDLPLPRPMFEIWVYSPRVEGVHLRFGRIARGERLIYYPEGVPGISKLWPQRYQLQDFGLGFMRLALETDTPIVPVAIQTPVERGTADEVAPADGSLGVELGATL